MNAVRIFNEKEVDELIVLDIDASIRGLEPDYSLVANLAGECRMPLCYGGGVKSSDQIEKLVSLGVEKVALGSSAIYKPLLIEESAKRVGNQSIVVVMDVKKTGILSIRHEIFTHNGTKPTGYHPVEFARQMESMGAGEILLNSIDRDGSMKGFDFDLIDTIRNNLKIPLTVLGGAGSLSDFQSLIARYGLIGAAAGSYFVFKGKYRAVLIQYVSEIDKAQINSALEK